MLLKDKAIVIIGGTTGLGLSAAKAFIADLAPRLANRVQLTTDGLRVYLDAVHMGFDTPRLRP